MTRRIVVGLSGGVDSAVAALLLKLRGYHVHGLFMRNWDGLNESGVCTADQDYEDARFVAEKLKIPLSRVDFVKEYWNQVFETFLSGYEKGIVPNPDILCNKYIKFDAFLKHATERLDADGIATGHYAGSTVEDLPLPSNIAGPIKLLKPVDSKKDQTLFLSQISQASLRRTLFPLAKLKKSEVKSIAMDYDMERIANRKESYGICFIGKRKFKRFLDNYIPTKKGTFINIENGKNMGEHFGVHHWTIGQRSGVHSRKDAFFVVKKDSKTQTVWIAPGTQHPALYSTSFDTDSVHWISGSPPHCLQEGRPFTCQFRFQHNWPLVSSKLTVLDSANGSVTVDLESPIRAISPGQYAVFYKNDECLGSAMILRPGISLFEKGVKGEYRKDNKIPNLKHRRHEAFSVS